nr:ATP-dependent DNA ligase [Propionibacterium sp.]
MASPAASELTIDGRRLRLTNLDKVMYPATGTTKGDVIEYYRSVAGVFVPHAAGRPATRKRWVHGVGGPAFFSKNADSGTPDWVRRVSIQHSRDRAHYPVVDDAATLVFLAQLAALEIHVPQWRFDADGVPQHPDRLVLDLDPGEGAGMAECVELALLVKEILDGVGLVSVPVTSGSKGLHLYAGLDGHLTSAEASDLARQLAVGLERSHPGLVVSDMKKDLRSGKVLLDWSQNNGAKTTVAPYSLRGRERPWVAAPRTWDEIAPGLAQLTYPEVLARLATIGDPLAVLLPAGQRVAAGPAGEEPDRLAPYRAKRDAARTPEPVPAAAPAPGGGHSFVIQEHHARRLHHDFRLERDGVLVSWAVPKLTPLAPKVTRLAVQTEDHPLEYGTFAGTIPAGEYGAGEVTIWDAGTYEPEKWREGREIVVTLHGRPDGGLGGVPRRYVLVHTGRGDAEKNWLLQLLADAPAADPAPDPPAPEPAPDPPAADAPAPDAPARASEAPRPRPTLADLPDPAPMLATLATEAELRGDDWHFEVKWDGYRGIAAVAGGEVRIGSRSKKLDLARTYPELRELATLVGDHAAVLDGEIVALDPDGRSNFELLQNHARGEAPAHYLAFDLLWLDGTSLLDRPYVERRRALEELLPHNGSHVHVPTTFGTDRELALRASRELELEGLIAKRPEGRYAPGRRSRTWLKIKNVRHQEAVVVGWSAGEGNRAGRIGSLLLAVNEDGRLVYIGRAGSGFGARSLADAERRLAPLARDTPPLTGVPRADARDAHWVEPVLVGEVSYGEWTSAGTLRHPVWRGWRPDADPAAVTRER